MGVITDDVWSYEACANVARALVELELRSGAWMHRRVETIKFIDDIRVRRHISIDFTIPEWPSYKAAIGALPQGFALVPIVRLKKGFSLRDFDLRDESGSPLAMLTKRQSQRVGAAILIHIAIAVVRQIGGARPSTKILSQLAQLVYEDTACVAEQRREDLVDRLKRSRDPHDSGLATDKFLIWAMTQLATLYILCALLRATPGERRVIKFAYEEPLVRDFGGRRDPGRPHDPCGPRDRGGPSDVGEFAGFLATLLGWRSSEIRMPVVVGGWGATHVEIPAPAELFLERAELYPARSDVTHRTCRWEVGPSRLVHLRSEREDAGLYILRLCFRLLPGGMVGSAMFLSLLTSGLLLGGLVVRAFAHARPAGEAPAAILLAVPGVLAAFVFSPGHHRLFERLFSGLRLTALGLAFLSIAAAAVLAVSFPLGGRFGFWIALTTLSLVALAVTAASWLLNRSKWLRRV